MKVFINPGHAPNGYPDPGAVSNGVRECDVVANVGNLLANLSLRIIRQNVIMLTNCICENMSNFKQQLLQYSKGVTGKWIFI